MQPDEAKLEELVKRIVDAVHPLRIILFGSAARGEMTPDSDLDVLVVMPDGTHRLHTAQLLHRRMLGLGMSVDILVATPCDLDRYGQVAGLIYRTILEEGRVVRAA